MSDKKREGQATGIGRTLINCDLLCLFARDFVRSIPQAQHCETHQPQKVHFGKLQIFQFLPILRPENNFFCDFKVAKKKLVT